MNFSNMSKIFKIEQQLIELCNKNFVRVFCSPFRILKISEKNWKKTIFDIQLPHKREDNSIIQIIFEICLISKRLSMEHAELIIRGGESVIVDSNMLSRY